MQHTENTLCQVTEAWRTCCRKIGFLLKYVVPHLSNAIQTTLFACGRNPKITLWMQ